MKTAFAASGFLLLDQLLSVARLEPLQAETDRLLRDSISRGALLPTGPVEANALSDSGSLEP